MATFRAALGRKTVHFTDHALDRWWERCEKNSVHGRQAAMNLLRGRLNENGKIDRSVPPWSGISIFNQARAEGFIVFDNECCFVINKNPSGDLVAVTYIEKDKRRKF